VGGLTGQCSLFDGGTAYRGREGANEFLSTGEFILELGLDLDAEGLFKAGPYFGGQGKCL